MTFIAAEWEGVMKLRVFTGWVRLAVVLGPVVIVVTTIALLRSGFNVEERPALYGMMLLAALAGLVAILVALWLVCKLGAWVWRGFAGQPPGGQTTTSVHSFGTVLASVALIISAGQAYVSQQSLEDSRQAALLSRRVEACATLVSAGYEALNEARSELPNQTRLDTLLRRQSDSEGLLQLIGPIRLAGTAQIHLTYARALTTDPRNYESFEVTLTALEDACREAVGVFD